MFTAELIDLIVSGLVLAFLVVCLLDLCCSRRRACETRLHSSSSTILAPDGLHEDNSKLKSCPHGSTCPTISPLVDLSEVVFGQPVASLSSFSPSATQTRPIPKYPAEQSTTARLCSYCPMFAGSDWSTMGRKSIASQTQDIFESAINNDNVKKESDSDQQSFSAVTQIVSVECGESDQQRDLLDGTSEIRNNTLKRCSHQILPEFSMDSDQPTAEHSIHVLSDQPAVSNRRLEHIRSTDPSRMVPLIAITTTSTDRGPESFTYNSASWSSDPPHSRSVPTDRLWQPHLTPWIQNEHSPWHDICICTQTFPSRRDSTDTQFIREYKRPIIGHPIQHHQISDNHKPILAMPTLVNTFTRSQNNVKDRALPKPTS
ncbi:hypothetical protein PHET_03499 [Paragonimus heterotremus]|uniref:Uncharacterized protein n=1 Tax=Paragonimus heterotremus TaxID=100268 RepID=A0A8J4TI14_9TREM|nr:hypothetical protein PHET_03499 [Paragonimus heterotremus]